ncbi:MAG: hypothetical protein WAN35_03240 [Terracidiphilus sp.]
MRASSSYVLPYVSVVGRLQTAQAINPSTGWTPPRVGSRFSICSEVTTIADIFGDLYHQASFEEADFGSLAKKLFDEGFGGKPLRQRLGGQKIGNRDGYFHAKTFSRLHF